VTARRETAIKVGSTTCRVWEAGAGEPLAFVAGFRGTPKWTPFLSRLAERRRLVVPSLPGFPGAEPGHLDLDDHSDWVAATLDLLEGAGITGADIVAASVGAMLVADAAAFSRTLARRLVLIGPLGLYSDAMPVRNPYMTAQADVAAVLCNDAAAYAQALACSST
jgi:pimeloyl-ACP methyl ester carboxylesterase